MKTNSASILPPNALLRYTQAARAKTTRSRSRAFTLIELLVVIAIIAILASLSLTALARARTVAKIQKTKLDISQIVSGVKEYESTHSLFPAATAVLSAAAGVDSALRGPEDCTYGLSYLTAQGLSPAPAVNTPDQTNNAEVIAILMDLETFGNGVQTVDFGHVKNPERHPYLNFKAVSDTTSPGIGLDGCLRDPWGTPYIITMDLNADNKARDAFYRLPVVSADQTDSNNPKRGLDGLVPSGPAANPYYEATTTVMVWSAGPDKQADPTQPGNSGANKDNILSWK